MKQICKLVPVHEIVQRIKAEKMEKSSTNLTISTYYSIILCIINNSRVECLAIYSIVIISKYTIGFHIVRIGNTQWPTVTRDARYYTTGISFKWNIISISFAVLKPFEMNSWNHIEYIYIICAVQRVICFNYHRRAHWLRAKTRFGTNVDKVLQLKPYFNRKYSLRKYIILYTFKYMN